MSFHAIFQSFQSKLMEFDSFRSTKTLHLPIPRAPMVGSKWRSLDPGISRWCHWDVSSSEHLKAYQPLPGWGGWKLHSLKLRVHSKSPWKLGLFAPFVFFHLPSSLIFRGELVSFGEGSRCWLGHDLGWIWKHDTNGQRSPGLILPECIFFSVWEKYGTWTVMISDSDLGILTPFSASMLIFKGVYQCVFHHLEDHQSPTKRPLEESAASSKTLPRHLSNTSH